MPGARYCTQCGEALRDRAPVLPWAIAGAAVVGLLVVLLAPITRSPEAAGPQAGAMPPALGGAAGSGESGSPPPLTGTPREQADRLFNRVMQASASGDTSQASFFMPMAVAAYQRIDDLDADGVYHLSLLHAADGDEATAQATAERILDASPNHLLGLGAAAQAAAARGDDDTARRYYERLLEHFDSEQQRALPEYADHASILPAYRTDAQRYLNGGR